MYSVWGFYIGALVGVGGLYFINPISTIWAPITIVFIAIVLFSGVGFILGKYINNLGRQDSKLEALEFWQEVLITSGGFGLPPLFLIGLILILLSHFGLHIWGF
jgi:hypothetical protein